MALPPGLLIVRFRRFNGALGAGMLEDDVIAVIEEPFWEELRPTGERVRLDDVTILAPCRPRTIVGVGYNYSGHLGDRPAPEVPAVFLKAPASVVGPGDDIILPTGAEHVIPEGEVVAVIGRAVRRASWAEAAQAVCGYTAGNDVTVRAWMRSAGDWWRAKGADTFSPFGPAIATGLDAGDIGLRTWVDGELVQEGTTADLVHDVPAVIRHVSAFLTLSPGDLIFTGTPGRAPSLCEGNVVEVEAVGAGILRNAVRASRT
jgi:2-keto-4-pentenoate hydratase/2-oxohepta-3-ene-1,7-dioic acid hydratase in catechol pathway